MLTARYQTLSDREKLTLWLGSLLALVLVGYLLLWRPLTLSNHSLERQIGEKQALVSWMQQASVQVQQLQRLTPQNVDSTTPVQQLITTHAGRQRIKLERMQSRNDNEAQLWLDDVEFNQLLGLLEQLHLQGVLLQKASLRATNNPGRIDAQLTLGR